MIKPKKSLGQNFLQDQNIVQKIVGSLLAKPEDLVIEIGPGTGALTRYLVKKYPNLITVELDERAEEVLLREMPNLNILHKDFLKVDLNSLKQHSDQKIYVIGNIPYYITSPILFHLFDQSDCIEQAVLMMQLEVAQRLNAIKRTKEYGILAVQTQYFSKTELLFKVPRQVFYPVPNVDSAVVSLLMNKQLDPVVTKSFKALVRMAFNQRRKKLSNSIKQLVTDESLVAEWMDKRAEELTVDEFVELSNRLRV